MVHKSTKDWFVEGPEDGFMNNDGSYGRVAAPDFDHDMPYNFEERMRKAEAERDALQLALDAHHRSQFPNLDPGGICRECGYDGIDVPTRQAYALAIENDCDADD